MNKTFPYRNYSFSKALRESPVISREAVSGMRRTVSPSPFEFPQQVMLRITEGGDLWFEFWYEFGEKVSDSAPPEIEDGGHAVLIGSDTGRIHAMRISNARAVLAHPSPFAELDDLSSLELPTLSRDKQRTFERSARVIGMLLKTMPEDLLTELRDALEALGGE